MSDERVAKAYSAAFEAFRVVETAYRDALNEGFRQGQADAVTTAWQPARDAANALCTSIKRLYREGRLLWR